MQFLCHRISLHGRTRDGFASRGEGRSVYQSREEFLRSLFKSQLDCRELGKPYVYDYEVEMGDFIGGVFGKRTVESYNAGPDKDWREEETSAWDPRILIIDPTEHSDGQKLYLESRSNEKHSRFLSALIDYVAADEVSEWFIDIKPIVDFRQIEEVFAEYRGQVGQISIDFPMPNMALGINNNIENLKKIYGEARASLGTTLSNDEGDINVDHEAVRSTVRTASESGAHVVVKRQGDETSGGRKVKVYDSKEKDRVKRLSAAVSGAIENVKDRVAAAIQSLGRSNDD